MDPTDLTLEVLRSIRDEARKTNERLEGVENELVALRQGQGRLEQRQTETEVRLATELVAVVQAVDQVKDLLAARLDLSEKLQDHERRIVLLENRAEP